MRKTRSEIEEKIRKMPTDNLWWKSNNYEALVNIAKFLIEEHSLPEEDVYKVIETCYIAVSSEYGN